MSRPTLARRTRLAALVLGSAALAGVLVPGASATPAGPPAAAPATAAPKHQSIASVTRELDRLAQQAERLSEQFNGTHVQLMTQQQSLARAQAAQRAADVAYRQAYRQFAALVEAQYESDPMGSMGAILTSKDPGAYISTLSTQALVAQHASDVLRGVSTARSAAAQARTHADELVTATRARRAQLAQKRTLVDAQVVKFQTTLSQLTAQQIAAYANRGAPTPAQIALALETPAPNPAAKKAVQFAVKQIGKPYVWAATGPDAFDCSGLTMAAWKQGGVSLPHFSATQYADARSHPAWDALEPGDLIFLYSDIHHVEIYIGAGIAISAPQEGEPVQYVHIADYKSDFYGAGRYA